MTDDLEDVARRMQAGEPEAFRAFADAVGPRLLRLGRYRGLSPADAEAHAVTVLGDIALKIDRFAPRGPGSFLRWVHQVAVNALRDEFRRRRPEPLADADSHAAPPEEEAAAAQGLAEAVRAVLDQLGEPDRTIVLARLETPDRTFAEIGQQVGLREGTVRVRHHRGLQRLAATLEQAPAVLDWLARLRPNSPSGDTP